VLQSVHSVALGCNLVTSEVEEKHLKSSELWCWRWKEKAMWVVSMRHKVV